MFKWIKKYLQKSVDSVLVLDPAWEVKPKKKKNGRRRMIKSRSSGYIRKPLRRPQSAGAQPGGTFPISTRYPPHYPVKISMYEQLKQIGFPAKEDV